MRPVRFTIANLILLVAFAAVAIAALKESSHWWDSGLFTVTLASLVTATLLAVHRGRRARAFWGGFALVGSAYLVASLVPTVEARLLTTLGLNFLEAKRPGRGAVSFTTVFVQQNGNPTPLLNGGSTTVANQTIILNSPQPMSGTARFTLTSFAAVPGSTPEDFIRVGHSLIALILAFLGGHLSRLLHASRAGRDSEDMETPTAPAAPDSLS
jgi:hypothetical protein